MKGDITRYIRLKAINNIKCDNGELPLIIASLILTPKIKIGTIKGKINRGNNIAPFLAPKIKAAPIMPIKDMLNPPIDILKIIHGI